MNDLEPIEIEFLMQSNELMTEFNKLIASSNAFDKSIDQTKTKFNEFVQSQLKAKGVLSENASLTDRQTSALKRHYEALAYLKEQIAKTTDPTQLGVYNYQLKQAEQAIKDIVAAANTKVELLNTAELEEQNRKLEQAGKTLDLIADKTFSFANEQELQVLSQSINEAGNELEQLGIVVDFVTAKFKDTDMEPQLLASLKDDIRTANEMLGRVPVVYDTAGNSINELADALKHFQEQLAQTSDPKDILVLNQNIENIETAITKLKNAGRTGFDEFGDKIVEQKPKTVQLQTELERLIQGMAKLRLENKANGEEYAKLRDRATEIRSALATINQEVNSGASSTGGLDTLIRVTSSISAGFALAQGSAALFGNENKDVAKTIQKVTGAMAVLQSMQQIQAELKRADSLATKAQTAYQAIYTQVVGQSTGALKTFRIALAATGVGLFVILLAQLINNWDKVKRAIGLTTDEMERNQAIAKKANDLYGDQVGKIKMLVELNKQEDLTTRQKQRAVKDFNKEFGNTLGSVKDYAELEKKIIANAPKYIEYLNVKAQAEAAYILSLERQKLLLEQITALSTGDLKWYEKLQNYSDKAYDKLWSVFGVKTETQYKISTEEQLRLLGLPTEGEFNKAIQGYSSVIQSNLKNMRKQQGEDNKLIGASLDLQKKAADLANSLGIKEDDTPTKTKTNTLLKERLSVLEAIAKAEQDYLKNSLNGLDKEIEDIRQKYTQLRNEAEKVKLSAENIERINELETKEIGLATYKDNTDKLIQQLEYEKEIYRLYEESKTLIGAEEITKRYADQLKDAQTFGERLQNEIAALEITPQRERSGAETERLNKLLEMQRVYQKELAQMQDDRFLSAYESTLTLQEQIALIEKEFTNKRVEIEKIANEELRNEKLKFLEEEKNYALNLVKNSYSQRVNIERKLVADLSVYTKKELQSRIRTVEEYLKKYGDLLNKEEKNFVELELNRAKSIIGITDLQTRQNALLREKETLENQIEKNKLKGLETTAEELNKLNEINHQLEEIGNDKTKTVVDYLLFGVDAAGMLGDSLRGVNGELADAVRQMADLASDFIKLAANLSSGDWAAAIGSAISIIIKVISEASRSSERALERTIKLQQEALRNQQEYNRYLREQALIEAGLNDEYQARIDAIKEERLLHEENAKAIKEEMEWLMRFLLVQRGGGSFKAPMSIYEMLGLTEEEAENLLLTDELLDRLNKLNTTNPFEGRAKEFLEHLNRLRDEYGSIEAAIRELDKEWKNIVTGTTAQSLADSIKQGIAEGKKSFADFADDIEGFLRNAILAGMSTKILEPQMQALQDMLYEMMYDGTITEDERKKFQEMYMRIVDEANSYMDMINQAGIDITGSNQANSLKGAIKGITEEQADLLAGQFGGLRLAQLETNQILRSSAAYQMQACSDMIKIQGQIEFNTRKTNEVLELIYKQLGGTFTTNSTNSLRANGF